ncbi:MAG: galactose-1-phosphate uridylyltransferase, partial [Desulfuromonadales bacterium]|nr:galactose-1-phosphate uridylyltransferase [Desulfuromonadales bacterium]
LAETVRNTLRRMRAVLKDPPFSFVLHNAPPMHTRWGCSDYWAALPAAFHWHIELVPKLTEVAGFEWGSGIHLNPTPPEEAAEFLRMAETIMVDSYDD